MSAYYTNKTAQSILDFLRPVIDALPNFIKKMSGSGMTAAEQEASSTTLKNQQVLNEEEYDRKIDFYERFESPAARVRQYKESGLNPMLLADGGASVSATGGVGSPGSASAQSMGIVDVLGSILGFANKRKELAQTKELTESSLGISQYEAETRRIQAVNYGEYLKAATQGQQNINDTFYTMFGLDVAEKEANISQKNAQTEYLVQVAASEPVRRQLMQSGIELNNVNVAIGEVQKAINEAALQYSDRYYKAVATISEHQATIIGVDADIATRLSKSGNDLLYHRAVAECADMIFEAGMKQDIWEGDAFKNSVSGTMTKKDWTQAVMSVIKTLIAGGAAVGVAGIRAGSRAVVPPMVNHPPQYSMDPTLIGTTIF